VRARQVRKARQDQTLLHCTSSRFTKSVIRSRAALTYAEAQSRMDDERLSDEITLGLRMINGIARILRR
jgi:exoribonuclease R